MPIKAPPREIRFQLRIPGSLMQRVQEEAQLQRRSVNAQLLYMVEEVFREADAGS